MAVVDIETRRDALRSFNHPFPTTMTAYEKINNVRNLVSDALEEAGSIHQAEPHGSPNTSNAIEALGAEYKALGHTLKAKGLMPKGRRRTSSRRKDASEDGAEEGEAEEEDELQDEEEPQEEPLVRCISFPYCMCNNPCTA